MPATEQANTMRSCFMIGKSQAARTSARLLLEELGFSVGEFSSGRDAHESYMQLFPSTLLVDTCMLDDPDLCRILADIENYDLSDRPVIVVYGELNVSPKFDMDLGDFKRVAEPFNKRNFMNIFGAV